MISFLKAAYVQGVGNASCSIAHICSISSIRIDLNCIFSSGIALSISPQPPQVGYNSEKNHELSPLYMLVRSGAQPIEQSVLPRYEQAITAIKNDRQYKARPHQ